MKKLIAIGIAATTIAIVCLGSDAVQPSTCTITNLRAEAVAYISAETYYKTATLRLTNCVAYSGTSTNSSVQSLTDVTVTVSIGDTSTNLDYTASHIVDTNGTWWCDLIVPSIPSPSIQVKLTDANTNVYIYPWKIVRTTDPM